MYKKTILNYTSFNLLQKLKILKLFASKQDILCCFTVKLSF